MVWSQRVWLAAGLASLSLAAVARAQSLVPVWTHTLPANNGTPGDVSLGAHGTQVFFEYGAFSDVVGLCSSFDQSPPSSLLGSFAGEPFPGAAPVVQNHRVSSARKAGWHAVVRDVRLTATATDRRAYLEVFTSNSPNPVVQYISSVPIPGSTSMTQLAISDDGDRVALAVYGMGTGTTQITVFDPTTGSNSPLYGPYSVNLGINALSASISGDGRWLLLVTGLWAYVIDVPTGAIAFQQPSENTATSAVSMSGDGLYFALGSPNKMRLFKRSGTTWQLHHTRTISGTATCHRVAVSRDNGTVAYCFTLNGGQELRIEAIDIPSLAVTMQRSVLPSGSFQCPVSDLAISDDGKVFAVGFWGDEPDAVPELQVYSKTSNPPIGTFDAPGSVLDLDLSSDGARVAVGCKATHANVPSSGGSIHLLEVGSLDVRVAGLPSLGDVVNLQIRGTPGDVVWLLHSPLAASPPLFFGEAGTLYLDRSTTDRILLGAIGQSGVINHPLSISGPAGTTRYYQGLRVPVRKLTKNWVRVTAVP